jgi:ribonuclease HI
MIIVICDGSSKGNPGPASIGVIAWERFKDSNPRMIKPTYHHHADIGVKTNMEAEWSALIHAVKYATSRTDSEEIYIYCDSQTVVKQATGVWKVKQENIRVMYNQLCEATVGWGDMLHISWIPRQLVYLADKEAQKGEQK